MVRVDSSIRKGSLATLAYKMARISGKATDYGPTYCPGDTSTAPYLYVSDGRVVAYLSTKEVNVWAHLDTKTVYEGSLPCAYHAFVCEEYQGQGIAVSLVERLASDHGIAPREIVFGKPFSTPGYRLARSVAGENMLVGG